MPAMLKSFAGKRVLVTGDTGFKGSWLTLILHDAGAELLGYALPPERPQDHYQVLGLQKLVRHIDSDIRDAEAVCKAFREFQPEFVFHLAAQPLVRTSYEQPKETFDTNVAGSVNILEAVRKTESVRSLVFVTSDKCYRNREWCWGYRETDELGGLDPYSASKAAAELVFAGYAASFFQHRPALGAATVRAGNVIGGGDWSADRIVPDCIRALQTGKPIFLRNPDATRPWQHVLDPLFGYLQLAARLGSEPKPFSGSWNFGPQSDSMRTVRDLATRILAGWGPGSIQEAERKDGPHEANLLHLNCDKAHFSLHWTPKWDFDTSVGETVRWYRDIHQGQEALARSRAQIKAFLEVGHD